MSERIVTVAATQMCCTHDIDANIKNAERLVRQAAEKGANIILLQELFETLYFCQEKNECHYEFATGLESNKAVKHFQKLALELKVVLPISFFEKKDGKRYNSVAMIDADGKVIGAYRKTHIPDGPGYEEKFYFDSGDEGFKVFETRYAKIGVGICWDQWFPEAARCMALMGAEILMYPTAIGSEPNNSEISSQSHWQICMQGHAAANILPVVVSNRIGLERLGESQIEFYGSSFITNYKGEIVKQADRVSETILLAEFDIEKVNAYREYWGVFNDRKPHAYGMISSNK